MQTQCSSDNCSNKNTNRDAISRQEWYNYTKREREEFNSLIRERNEDLSIHLFNAHILSIRAKEYEIDSANAKVNTEYPYIPEEHRTFKPTNRWTAWPLTPKEVPRTTDNDGEDNFNLYSSKKKKIDRPSSELEDVLMGITLKFARKNFESRQCDTDKRIILEKTNSNKTTFDDNGIQDENYDSLDSQDFSDSSRESLLTSKQTRAEYLEPVISCDDERSRQLIRPSLRHILTQIEKVLMGLHNSRKAYYSFSHLESIEDRKSTSSRYVGKSCRRNIKTPRTMLENEKIDLMTQPKNNDELSQSCRQQRIYERLDGETDQEFLVRVTSIMNSVIPSIQPMSGPAKPAIVNLNSPPRTYRNTPEDRFNNRKKRLGLRDWSEVIGVAAMVGIHPGAIARATQRCSNLFDESILMRSMTEAHHNDPSADSIVYCGPSTSQYKSSSIIGHETRNLIPHTSNLITAHVSSSSSKIPSSKCDLLGKQTYFCPIIRCPRMLQGFKDKDALIRHLTKGHSIEKAVAYDLLIQIDKNLDGAVHVDGFLKSIQTSTKNTTQTKKKDISTQNETEGNLNVVYSIGLESSNSWTSASESEL